MIGAARDISTTWREGDHFTLSPLSGVTLRSPRAPRYRARPHPRCAGAPGLRKRRWGTHLSHFVVLAEVLDSLCEEITAQMLRRVHACVGARGQRMHARARMLQKKAVTGTSGASLTRGEASSRAVKTRGGRLLTQRTLERVGAGPELPGPTRDRGQHSSTRDRDQHSCTAVCGLNRKQRGMRGGGHGPRGGQGCGGRGHTICWTKRERRRQSISHLGDLVSASTLAADGEGRRQRRQEPP